MSVSAVRRRAEQRVGTTLCGKWRLDAIVGAGGMATVYAATHRNRSRVAIKILHPEYSIDDQIRTRFLREGYVANTIGHAGAVSIIDDDKAEDGSAFLVMELLSGETLGQRLRRHRGRFPPREALLLTEQLLDLLRAAHAKGVVHRDIKPENLFITVNGQLKVLDFGIARLRATTAPGSTTLGTFFGTPGYAPPEQARGRSDEVDARSDLYAVGATLFTMLTGRLVHEAETATERIALTISLPAPSVVTVASELPPSVALVVDRALRYDKKERWPTAKDMLAAVRAALQGTGGGEAEAEPPGTQDMPSPLLERLLDDCRTTVSLGNGPSSAIRMVGNRWPLKIVSCVGGVALLGGALYFAPQLLALVGGSRHDVAATAAAATVEPSAAPPEVRATPSSGSTLVVPSSDEAFAEPTEPHTVEPSGQAATLRHAAVGAVSPKPRSPGGVSARKVTNEPPVATAPPSAAPLTEPSTVVAPNVAVLPPAEPPPTTADVPKPANVQQDAPVPSLFSRRH